MKISDDDVMVKIFNRINKLRSDGANPKFVAMNKKLHKQLMDEFKDSLMFSELEHSFLSKVEELEKEIGRFDLKISVGKLHGLHIILSNILKEDEYVIL